MEKEIWYKGDCPNEGDFERVQKNLEIALKTQKEFYKSKKKQPIQSIKYYERSLN